MQITTQIKHTPNDSFIPAIVMTIPETQLIIAREPDQIRMAPPTAERLRVALPDFSERGIPMSALND